MPSFDQLYAKRETLLADIGTYAVEDRLVILANSFLVQCRDVRCRAVGQF